LGIISYLMLNVVDLYGPGYLNMQCVDNIRNRLIFGTDLSNIMKVSEIICYLDWTIRHLENSRRFINIIDNVSLQKVVR